MTGADGGPAMSVVVMGYRNADTIVRAARSVVDQAGDDVEVVVVTSGGDDSAARVRAVFSMLMIVESPHRLMPGGARNAGIAASRGRVVAFLAADCVAEPGWVEHRRRRHDEGHAVVASAVTNGDRRRLAAWGFHFGVYGNRLAGRPAGPIAGTDGGAHGCSFDRAVLEQIGGFGEVSRIGEDTDAVRLLHALGVPLWYEPMVQTTHIGPRTTVALVRDRHRRGARRAGVRGAVAAGWAGVVGELVRSQRSLLKRYYRFAGADRAWFVLSVPWVVLGNAAALVGQQRGAARRARATRRPDQPTPLPTTAADPASTSRA